MYDVRAVSGTLNFVGAVPIPSHVQGIVGGDMNGDGLQDAIIEYVDDAAGDCKRATMLSDAGGGIAIGDVNLIGQLDQLIPGQDLDRDGREECAIGIGAGGTEWFHSHSGGTMDHWQYRLFVSLCTKVAPRDWAPRRHCSRGRWHR